ENGMVLLRCSAARVHEVGNHVGLRRGHMTGRLEVGVVGRIAALNQHALEHGVIGEALHLGSLRTEERKVGKCRCNRWVHEFRFFRLLGGRSLFCAVPCGSRRWFGHGTCYFAGSRRIRMFESGVLTVRFWIDSCKAWILAAWASIFCKMAWTSGVLA